MFEQPAKKESEVITKEKLYRLLKELDLDYSIEEDGRFRITINIPEKYVAEKKKLERISVLSESIDTQFDRDKFWPLFRAIQNSANLSCEVINPNEDDRYTIYFSFPVFVSLELRQRA